MNRNIILVAIVVLLVVLAYSMWGRNTATMPAATTTPADTTQPATTPDTQTQ